MTELLTFDFMQRALIAALLVGIAAPMVGIFLVQRRLSLIGDGMGHVALAGVAVGLAHRRGARCSPPSSRPSSPPSLIELLRARGRTSGDVALAVIFYGGIAAGVVIITKSPDGTPANLMKYLFGSILTTQPRRPLRLRRARRRSSSCTTWALRPRLFAVANDEEYARAVGMPVLPLNIVLAVLTAITVVVAMRVVGLLLISALMIVPNAAAPAPRAAASAAGSGGPSPSASSRQRRRRRASSYRRHPVRRHHRAARRRRSSSSAPPSPACAAGSRGRRHGSPSGTSTSTARSAATRPCRTATTSTTSTTGTCTPPHEGHYDEHGAHRPPDPPAATPQRAAETATDDRRRRP